MLKTRTKSIVLAVLIILFIILFLTNTSVAIQFAYLGLEIWFKKMIPSLFPMMVIMNFLIYSNLSDLFIKPAAFILKPIFKVSDSCIFVIFFGFLCGFPLGLKSSVDLYKNGKINNSQAEFLLCFCNQLGPAYFLGFVLKEIYTGIPLFLSIFLMYGIPFLYGILLRYTVYFRKGDMMYAQMNQNKRIEKQPGYIVSLSTAFRNACEQITILGGYMVVFNSLRILPTLLYKVLPIKTLYIFFNAILEVSGGLYCISENIKNSFGIILSSHMILSFSGLCCFFQSAFLISQTNLSAKKYMLHRLIICSITILIICIWAINKTDF